MTESERLRVARQARAAALAVDGVRDTDGGPLGRIATVSGDERVLGVTCTSAGDAGWDVSVRLVCELVPLPDLAQRVRTAVTGAAAAAGLVVHSVTVHIAQLAEAAA